MEEYIFVRTTSHRSRERLHRALGFTPKYWTDYGRSAGGVYVRLTPEQWESVRHVNGINRARIQGDRYSPCWGQE